MSQKKQTWYEARVCVPDAQAEDAAVWLVDSGLGGVQTIAHENAQTELVIACETSFCLLGDLAPFIANTLLELNIRLSQNEIVVTQESHDDWAHAWKAFFKPLQLSTRLWVVPSWEPTPLLPEGAQTIVINPGMAFGTGQHATTALCVQALERYLSSDPDVSEKTLLDLGCGTGLLAIAGLKMGISEAWAIDNDPDATRNARENVLLNHVSDRMIVSDENFEQCPRVFDVIVANILAHTLIEMSAEVVAHVAADGIIILSGILESQAQDVVDCYLKALTQEHTTPWVHAQTLQEGEWVALVFKTTDSVLG